MIIGNFLITKDCIYMLEIIYRIYEVADEETAKRNSEINCDFGLYSSTSQNVNTELLMDCCICDDREHFKSIIRGMYGENIPFRQSKKLQPGEVYCIIIGEHCYNTERYFNKIEFECDYCHSHVQTYLNRPICIQDYDIDYKLYGKQEYKKKRFCSNQCKSSFIDEERYKLKPDDIDHFFVTREQFVDDHIVGYIYKITKKSTNQFYVGQTKYIPIFRWGEHLHTERFPVDNICDYKFEVIEIVYKGNDLLDREKYWIQSFYKQNPELSLNIACTKGVISY